MDWASPLRALVREQAWDNEPIAGWRRAWRPPPPAGQTPTPRQPRRRALRRRRPTAIPRDQLVQAVVDAIRENLLRLECRDDGHLVLDAADSVLAQVLLDGFDGVHLAISSVDLLRRQTGACHPRENSVAVAKRAKRQARLAELGKGRSQVTKLSPQVRRHLRQAILNGFVVWPLRGVRELRHRQACLIGQV